MTWLITGGAGYIGAHITHEMVRSGHHVVILDDFSTGNISRVPSGVNVYNGSINNAPLLEKIVTTFNITGVIHAAAKKRAGESVIRPEHYYEHNVSALWDMMTVLIRHNIKKIVFCSSAAVYGTLEHSVSEKDKCSPESPYGNTKLCGESILSLMEQSHGLSHVNLRLFNVAGNISSALKDTELSNVIPIVIHAARQKKSPIIFGHDYATADGTAIRDYVHAADVATAAVLSVNKLEETKTPFSLTANVGSGVGTSVRDVVHKLKSAAFPSMTPVFGERRSGDPARIVADISFIRSQLGWFPRYGIDDIIASAVSSPNTVHQEQH